MYYVLARYSAFLLPSPLFLNEKQLEIDWHIFCTISSLRYAIQLALSTIFSKLLPYAVENIAVLHSLCLFFSFFPVSDVGEL